MITALQIIFSPLQAWERIAKAQREVPRILLLHVFPLLLPGLALEGFSLVRFGERRGELEYIVKISEDLAIRYATAEFVLLMASVLVGALIVRWVTASVQVQTPFTACFTLMAYGFSPIFLARYFDAIPGLDTWVCWTIGALLASSALYHGVGPALKPEQTKGFGLFLVSVIIVVFASGLSHFVALALLHGKILH